MISRKNWFIINIGCMFESYDYYVYTFLLIVLRDNLFINISPENYAGIIFVIFGTGAIARPLGGIIFGYIGDARGRALAVSYSMLFSGLCTFMIAFLPSYQEIGFVAPVLYCVIRFIQGLCFGGNMSGILTFVFEGLPASKRLFWIGSIIFSVLRGILLALGITWLLKSFLSEAQFIAWGWRLCFVVGFIPVITGIYFRYHLKENPYIIKSIASHRGKGMVLIRAFARHKLNILFGFGISVFSAMLMFFIVFYLHLFFDNYMINRIASIRITMLAVIIFSTFILAGGWVMSRYTYNPGKLMFWASLIFICCIYWVFNGLSSTNVMSVITALVSLSIMAAIVCTAAPILLLSMFPAHVRCTGVGFTHNITFAIVTAIVPISIRMVSSHLPMRTTLILFLFGSGLITCITCYLFKDRRFFLLRDRKRKHLGIPKLAQNIAKV